MDDRRVGRLIRAARVRKRWRQVDLEAACGVDQSWISRIERGWMDAVTLRTLRAVGEALGVPIELWPRMSPAEISTLMDEGHAALVERVLAILHGSGWETIAEYTFSHYGERGSVDIVAWHAARRTILIVEIKTTLVDLQDLLSTLDRKCRVVPRLLALDRGWHARAVARLLVVEDSSVARRVVAAHRATFDTAFPQRARAFHSWLVAPAAGSLSALWFLPDTPGGHANRRTRRVRRVRRPRASDSERERVDAALVPRATHA